MKAVRIVSPGNVEMVDLPKPLPKPGEALLKLLYGGICGSDLGSYRGTFAYFEYPRVPGHEFSAEIAEINGDGNPEYAHLKTGMVVTCNPYFNCGTCYACRRGLLNCCESNQTLGCQREGAFAEYVTMPLPRIYDGKGVDPKTLSLIEPFCISHHGVSRSGVRRGDRVLVVGAGTIGVLAGVAAKAKGADVYMTDVAPAKLEYAMQFGFKGSFVNADGAFEKNIRDITGGDGFDVTVEAVGLPSTFQNCIDAAAFGGSVALIGVGKKNLDFNFTLIQKKELNVFGSRNALKKNFLELIDLVKEGDIDLGRIVTNTYAWTDAAAAFADFDKNAGIMLKILLDFTK